MAEMLAVNHNFRKGFWRLADPKISLASLASMFLGACAAAAVAPLHFGWLLLTVLGIFAIEVAKNASGEIFDFDSGADLSVLEADRSPFSGGKRVLVDGLLTRRETIWIAGVCYALGLTAGLIIALGREPRILVLGLAGLACAYGYHAPPLKLSYRGWGEGVVGLCYGPLIALGTFLVQTGFFSQTVILASVPLGILIAAFLWINEFPDAAADAAAGKRTWVVRLGRRRASRVFGGLLAAAFLWTGGLPWMGLPPFVLLALVAWIPAVAAARCLMRHYDRTAKIIPAQAQTLLSFVLYAAGCGVGFLVA